MPTQLSSHKSAAGMSPVPGGNSQFAGMGRNQMIGALSGGAAPSPAPKPSGGGFAGLMNTMGNAVGRFGSGLAGARMGQPQAQPTPAPQPQAPPPRPQQPPGQPQQPPGQRRPPGPPKLSPVFTPHGLQYLNPQQMQQQYPRSQQPSQPQQGHIAGGPGALKAQDYPQLPTPEPGWEYTSTNQPLSNLTPQQHQMVMARMLGSSLRSAGFGDRSQPDDFAAAAQQNMVAVPSTPGSGGY